VRLNPQNGARWGVGRPEGPTTFKNAKKDRQWEDAANWTSMAFRFSPTRLVRPVKRNPQVKGRAGVPRPKKKANKELNPPTWAEPVPLLDAGKSLIYIRGEKLRTSSQIVRQRLLKDAKVKTKEDCFRGPQKSGQGDPQRKSCLNRGNGRNWGGEGKTSTKPQTEEELIEIAKNYKG